MHPYSSQAVDAWRNAVAQDQREMTLNERLGLARAHARLTVREWATKAGLSPNHVSTLQSRLRREPDARFEAKTIAALARAAGVSLRWLATGDGPMFEEPLPTRPDEVYPRRAAAVFVAEHLEHLPQSAIAEVMAISGLPDDLPTSEWLRLIESAARKSQVNAK